MVSIVDVARFILDKKGPMPAMKLQKLCYYSQAWGLVWDEKPLFSEDFQAWANGPVAPELFKLHKNKFMVYPDDIAGAPDALNQDQRETVEAVLDTLGDYNGAQLSEMTHRENPWFEARGDTPIGARSNTVILQSAMAEYYASLYTSELGSDDGEAG